MDPTLQWPTHPSSSASSSSNPPARLWDSSGLFLSGAGNLLVGAAPSPRNPFPQSQTLDPWDHPLPPAAAGDFLAASKTPSYPYSLESALSNLSLYNNNNFNYNHLLDVGPMDPLPDSLPFLDRESSDFYALRSSNTHLLHHRHFNNHNNTADFYPFLTTRTFSNLPPSSLSDFPAAPVREPCNRPHCSCHFNHHHHHNHNSSSSSSSSSSYRRQNQSARPRRAEKLEYDPSSSSVNLMSLRGSVVEWAKDQNGCRILQAKFHHPKEEEIEMVLSEILDHLPELMIHSFANYFIQKLIDVCSDDQRYRLLLAVIRNTRRLTYICFDNHGTRVMQKLLEKLTNPHQIFQFMVALAPGVVDLIKDMNGNHVIQHCLKNFTPQQNEFLIHEVAENCFDIATDKSGCCVLQQCVDSAEGEGRERLLFKIIVDALQLAEDRYGNYVLQHVLDLNDHQINAKIVKQLKGSFVQLARNKFASHVVEKCLLKTDPNIASIIVYEVLKSSKAADLLLDPYGNFVIQAALELLSTCGRHASQDALYYELMMLIQTFISPMRTNMFGRKILEWFDRKGQKLYV